MSTIIRSSAPASTNFTQKLEIIRRSFQAKGDIVDLADHFLGDECCESIVSAIRLNPNKTHLNLRGNQIQAYGAKQIANMLKSNSSLKALNIEWNNVGLLDNGICELANAIEMNSTLVQLDLRNNNIGPDGAVALARALKRNKTLASIDLRWNDIGLTGSHVLLDAIKQNFTVITLALSGNNIPSSITMHIERLLNRNQGKYDAGTTAKGDALLLDCLADKEKTSKLLEVTQEQLLQMRHRNKLRDDKLKQAEVDLKEKHEQLRTLNEELSALNARVHERDSEYENLWQQKHETEKLSGLQYKELEKRLSNTRDELAHSEASIERLNRSFDIRHQEAQDAKRKAELHAESMQITLSATTKELERTRMQHEDERKRWLTDRQELLDQTSEKILAIQTQSRATLKEYEEKLSLVTNDRNEIENNRKALNLENESLRSKILQQQLQREKDLSSLELNLQHQMEQRVAASLTGLESNLRNVQLSRDQCQKQVEQQTKTISSLQEQHVNQLRAMEEHAAKQKDDLEKAESALQASDDEKIDLQSKFRAFEQQIRLLQSKVNEYEVKYSTAQALNAEQMKHLSMNFENDRKVWEKAVEQKGSRIAELETLNQRLQLALAAVKQEEQHRMNEMAESIGSFLKTRFIQERERLQNEADPSLPA